MPVKRSTVTATQPVDRPSRVGRRSLPSIHSSFEEHVLTTLEAQDRLLGRVEEKLGSPILNGGFDSLVKKVDKIESVTEQMRAEQAASSKKVDAIHVAIYDPDTGLYGRVKEHTAVITKTGKGLSWFIGILIAGGLGGIGKLLYDFMSGHIHFTP